MGLLDGRIAPQLPHLRGRGLAPGFGQALDEQVECARRSLPQGTQRLGDDHAAAKTDKLPDPLVALGARLVRAQRLAAAQVKRQVLMTRLRVRIELGHNLGLRHNFYGNLGSTDDGGPRRQPELAETVAYDPELAAPAADLGLLDDDDDPPLRLPRQLDPAMQRTARLASLDPNDGIEL